MSSYYEILNKGVPANIDSLPININTVLDLSLDRDYAEKYFNRLSERIFEYLDKKVYHGSLRYLLIYPGLILNHDSITKTNELFLDAKSILKGFIKNLNCEEDLINTINSLLSNYNLSNEEINDFIKQYLLNKCNSLGMVYDDQILKTKYPMIYEAYQKEKAAYESFKDDLKMYKGNKKKLYEDYKARGGPCSFEVLCDTLNMYSVRNFTKFYSSIIYDIIDNFEEIGTVLASYKTNILDDIKCDKDELEAFIAKLFIERINAYSDIKSKQNDLYYLTSYFNSHKDLIGTNKVFKRINCSFDDLYNKYIDILVNNPELKVIDIKRDEFENFTQEEVNEYMDLELNDARGNWVFFDESQEDERIARAIANSTTSIKDVVKKKKTQEELKELLLKKKKLFENATNFRVVEGKNSFDGYLAYIFPNGKVIMERYFERLKNGQEKIANEQAIYVMNIDEFSSISKLSKTTIIRDKLCKRYYHTGKWVEKVLKEINSDGSNPFTDYNELLKSNKVQDDMYLGR